MMHYVSRLYSSVKSCPRLVTREKLAWQVQTSSRFVDEVPVARLR